MNKILVAIFGSSPRTTILGILGAIIAIVPQYVVNGKVDWLNLVIAAFMIAFGRLSKDSDGVNRKASKEVAETVLPTTDVSKP